MPARSERLSWPITSPASSMCRMSTIWSPAYSLCCPRHSKLQFSSQPAHLMFQWYSLNLSINLFIYVSMSNTVANKRSQNINFFVWYRAYKYKAHYVIESDLAINQFHTLCPLRSVLILPVYAFLGTHQSHSPCQNIHQCHFIQKIYLIFLRTFNLHTFCTLQIANWIKMDPSA